MPLPGNFPAEKAEALKRQQRQLLDARAAATPKALTTRPIPPTAVAQRPLPTGIAETKQGPFPSGEFSIINVFQGRVGDRWLTVYAGARKDPPGRAGAKVIGGLRVYTSVDGHKDIKFQGTFDAPGADGHTLTIVDFKGSTLLLKRDDGAALSFDMAKLAYVP